MNVQPIISIVMVIFNMAREIKRTLHSLTSTYQVDVSGQDYEVVVVDNGSSTPLSVDYVKSFGSNFNYHYIEDALPSPAPAINFGVRQSRGRAVGIMIDGARILSPGIIKYALQAFRTFQNPVVATLGWHLGPDLQNHSVLDGYNQQVEDQLLASINWPKDGYRLFEISALASSSKEGWFMPQAESNCLFMLRETFDNMGGYEERFNTPGGGLVNLDMYTRACELPDAELVVILGEGNFHQIHGGIATNVSETMNRALWQEWQELYFKIRQKEYTVPLRRPDHFIGHMPQQALKWVLYSAEIAVENLTG